MNEDEGEILLWTVK